MLTNLFQFLFGFWFKFLFELGINYGVQLILRRNWSFRKTGNSYDEVLIISSVGISAFVIASYLSKFFLIFNNLQNTKNYFYVHYKNYIYFSFLIVISVSYLNIYYGIYQKGLVVDESINIYLS